MSCKQVMWPHAKGHDHEAATILGIVTSLVLGVMAFTYQGIQLYDS